MYKTIIIYIYIYIYIYITIMEKFKSRAIIHGYSY